MKSPTSNKIDVGGVQLKYPQVSAILKPSWYVTAPALQHKIHGRFFFSTPAIARHYWRSLESIDLRMFPGEYSFGMKLLNRSYFTPTDWLVIQELFYLSRETWKLHEGTGYMTSWKLLEVFFFVMQFL